MLKFPLLVALLGCLALGVSAQGRRFPYFDNCRRSAKYSSWDLKALPVLSVPGAEGVVKMCFQINLKSTCTPEVFKMKGRDVTSRCCNTGFGKVKFYVDPQCREQFSPGELTVPNSKRGVNYNRLVSPTWTKRPVQLTEVKYTQFGPIPHEDVEGTTFCLRMKPGPCKLSDFTDLANPVSRAKRQFQVALYDRKVDGYECCPTFNFATDRIATANAAASNGVLVTTA